MRFLYDAFCFVLVMIGAFCIGTGIALLADVGIDVLFQQGRHQHPSAVAVIGGGFILVGALEAWLVRVSYNFFTLMRIR